MMTVVDILGGLTQSLGIGAMELQCYKHKEQSSVNNPNRLESQFVPTSSGKRKG